MLLFLFPRRILTWIFGGVFLCSPLVLEQGQPSGQGRELGTATTACRASWNGEPIVTRHRASQFRAAVLGWGWGWARKCPKPPHCLLREEQAVRE